MHTGIFHTLDLERDGKTLSHLGLPFSVDRSPYFQVKVPVCVIRNGAGPSALLLGGVHGDEYEGELSLARLIRKMDPFRMRGRVTILPLTNAPAVLAARRCSPLDGGNLNRAFPGDPDGTPTRRLAHFLASELFPRHDIVFDIHSGGTSMTHLPLGADRARRGLGAPRQGARAHAPAWAAPWLRRRQRPTISELAANSAAAARRRSGP